MIWLSAAVAGECMMNEDFVKLKLKLKLKKEEEEEEERRSENLKRGNPTHSPGNCNNFMEE
jgi:hypothetical protein